jgi:hypothetical protein
LNNAIAERNIKSLKSLSFGAIFCALAFLEGAKFRKKYMETPQPEQLLMYYK